MAFEIYDFQGHYVKKGDYKGLFNVARSDESETSGATRYYAYLNENGAFVIQSVATSGSLTVKVYSYYGNKSYSNLATAWTNRASLTYVDYQLLFP